MKINIIPFSSLQFNILNFVVSLFLNGDFCSQKVLLMHLVLIS